MPTDLTRSRPHRPTGNSASMAVLEATAAGPSAPVKRYGTAPTLRRLAVAAMLGFILIFGYFTWLSYRHALEDAQREGRELVRLAEGQASRMFEAAVLLLTQMSGMADRDLSNPIIQSQIGAELTLLKRALPFIDSLSIVDASGRPVASTVEGWWSLGDVSDRPYFRGAMATAGESIVISDPLAGRLHATPFFATSRAVLAEDGSPMAVVMVAMNPIVLSGFFDGLELGFDSTFELFTKKGALLARAPQLPPEILFAAKVNETTQQEIAFAVIGATEYVDRNGERRIGFYRKLNDLPVFVQVGLSHRAIRDAWLRGAWPQLVLVLLAAVAFTLLYRYAYRRAVAEDQMAAELEQQVAAQTADLKETVRQKEILLRELHHRVKNNLQVVMSLVMLEAGSKGEAAPNFVTETRRRLLAMSKMHEQLYLHGDAAQLELGPYLQRLAEEIAQAYGVNERVSIELDAEEVLIGVDQGTPLALFAGEVLSNAFKHAFPEGQPGKVRIGVHKEAEKARLTIEDDGIGMAAPAAAEHKSLGTNLIANLARQIGGELTSASDSQGTRYSLLFEPD